MQLLFSSFFSQLTRIAIFIIVLTSASPLWAEQNIPAPVSGELIELDVQAGPLSQALNQLARSFSLALSYDPALVENKTSSGLQGRYSLRQALKKMLSGTDIVVRYTGGNSAFLEKAVEGEVTRIAPLRVRGTELSGITEDTDSYSSGRASAAVRLDLSLRQTPQAVSVVTHQQIEDQNLSTLYEVLKSTPGVVADKFDERVKFTSRGYDLNYMVDGVPSFAFKSVAGEASMVSSAIYDRIEVVRGAAGLLNGVGSPGGAVNLVRKRPTDEFKSDITVGAGSWSNYNAEVDMGGRLTTSGGLRGRAVVSFADGDSFIDHKSRNEKLFYGIVEADALPDMQLSLGYEYQETEIEGANFGQAPLFYSDGSRTDFSRSFNSSLPWSFWGMTTNRVFIDVDQHLKNDWAFKASASYTKSRRDRYSGDMYIYPTDLDSTTGDTTIELADNPAEGVNTSFDAFLHGPFQLLGREHQAAIGFNYNHYDYEYQNDGAVEDSFDTRIVNLADFNSVVKPDFIYPLNFTEGEIEESAVYASVQLKPVDPLSVLIGGRFTWYKSNESYRLWTFGLNGQKFEDPEVDESAVFTPYLGATYDVSEAFSLYSSYTEIFEPNNKKDRRNKTLDPKRGENIEVGIKGEHRDGLLTSSFSLFQSEEDNVPVVDAGFGLLPDGSRAYRAVEGTRSEGAELTLAGEVLRNWQLMGSYTYFSREDRDGEQLDSTIPQRLLRLYTRYRLPALNKLTVGGHLSYQSGIEFEEDYGLGQVSQGGVTLLGLMARYEFDNGFNLVANIDNVTDKEYYSGLGGYNGYVYGAPRIFSLKINYSF